MKTTDLSDAALTKTTSGPLVSVIIPTYGRAHLVPKAIESVRCQSFQNLEILVVDDGSSDDTGKVVCNIQDPRIRYIRHERNKGLPAARNTGIRVAKGEYIAFLDDDDEWQKDKLAKQLLAITNVDAVLSGALINGSTLKLHGRPYVTLNDLKTGNEFDPSSLLAKAYVLREVLFDENLRQGEDWDAFIRIAMRYRIGYVNEPLLLYNDGAHERMTNEARNRSVSVLDLRTTMLSKHKEFFGPYWYRYHVADVFLSYLRYRENKIYHVGRTIMKCGPLPVCGVIARKMMNSVWSIFHA